MGVLDKVKPKKRRSGNKKSKLGPGLIGLAVVLVSIVAVVFALNATKGIPGKSYTFVRAAFSDTGDIHVDGDVREADVRIGRISSIDLENGQGIITMQFDDTRPVYKNATAQIVSRSGLGQKFLNVNRGDPASGQMGQYDTIPITQTAPSVEILDLADLFTPQTTAAAQNSLQQLGAGLQGHTQDLRDAFDGVSFNLPRLSTVAQALNSHNGNDINATLSSIDNLSAQFQGREQQITDLNRQLATTFDAVNVNRGQGLRNLLQVAPPAFATVRQALQNIQAPLETTNLAVVNLQPAAASLVAATPDTRGVLREAPTPLAKVPGVSQVGTPAVASLTPVFQNLQPLSPKVTQAVNLAEPTVRYLEPNANDISIWFTRATKVLSQGDGNGNWARFDAIPSCGIVTGAFLQLPGNDCRNTDGSPNGTAGTTTANSGTNNPSGSGATSSAVPNLSSLTGGGR